jgi:thiol-disulfide isomerase/thioredoxin
MDEEIIIDGPRNVTPIEAIIGSKFLNNKNEEISYLDSIFNCNLYGLFFTASWCSPCELFVKDLIDIYINANEGIRNIEIIQINYEKEEGSFKSNIADRPWVFMPHNDPRANELKEKFNILYIPVLVIFKSDGTLLTTNGRQIISNEGVNAIDKWLI